MPNDNALRQHLLELLRGGHAHATFDDAVAGFPVELAGKKVRGLPYSAWQMLEHMRIAQWDILEFSRSARHQSPKWPEGYWPSTAAPSKPEEWQGSLRAFRKDLKAMQSLVADEKQDLYARIPHGTGQTLLREALLVADHNAYHLGQFVLLRRLLGAWSK
jgi:hypothetical protein